MEFPLSAKYGLLSDEIERRLMMFGIGLEDARHLSTAREIVAARVDYLVDVFYRHLFAFPELMRFISAAEISLRLRSQLREYLLTLAGSGKRAISWLKRSHFICRLRWRRSSQRRHSRCTRNKNVRNDFPFPVIP